MKNIKNKTAFSLVELSIVILVIGIVIAGITQSSRLIAQFRLTTARSTTESSPATSIRGMVQWYEATSVASFDEDETEDHDLDIAAPGIATWFDINQTDGTRNNATNAVEDSQPFYYADCINDLPCVRFDGIDDTLAFDGSGIVGSDYTIFAVVQRRDGTANFFIGNTASVSANEALGFGYNADDTFIISQGDITNASTVDVGDFTNPVPELHTIINDSVSQQEASLTHYLNGNDTASVLTAIGTPDLDTLSAYANASLGANGAVAVQTFYNGDIGEIIIYNRALKIEERNAVENYLLDKWSIN